MALGIELVVLYVAAEAAPKTWALQNTDVAAVRVAPLVRALAALAPLRWILRLLIGVANLLVPGKAPQGGPVGLRGRTAGAGRGGGRGVGHRGQ